MRRIAWREVVAMKRLRLVLGVAAVFVILAVPASASAPGWSRVPTPNPLGPDGQPISVSCLSTTSCIAVGTYVDASGTGVTLAQRWNGTVWTVQPTPNPTGSQLTLLNGVSCTSSSACVAVGLYLDGSGASHALAEGWDGTKWTLESVPEPLGAQNSQLNAVSCLSASSCVAVGGYTNSLGGPVTLAERWTGAAWAVQSTPNPTGAQFSFLAGVACVSSTACIAVGVSDQGSLAEHWDGTSWSIRSTPTSQSPGAALFSVSCTSASACVAVGSTSPNSGMTLAERWNGSNWTLQSTPNPAGSQDAVLNSVACSSSSACTAVGWSVDSSNTFSTVAERWNGDSWSLQSTPNDPGLSQLGGVACPTDSACIAAGIGVDASGALVSLNEGWDGTQWSIQPAANPLGTRGANLFGVSCKSASACMAVGQLTDFPQGNPRGTLAETFDGTTWRIVPTPNPDGAPNGALNGVSCTSPSTCVAVGAAFDSSGNSVGTLTERWNGTSWSIQPTPTSSSPGAFLNAVSCTSPNACSAVGNNSVGQVMAERWNGASWSVQPVPAPAGAPISFLTGVSCTSAVACTAVGAILDSSGNNSLGTVAEQWNGTTWTLQRSSTSQSPGYFLGAVSCTSASACTAVGNTDTGLLAERSDGKTWTVQSAVTPPGTERNGDFFSGVSCSTPSACTAVGLVFGPGPSIVAERWDGKQWTIQPTPNIPGVYDMAGPAVSCPILSTCTAVGGYRNDGPGVTLAEQWNGQPGSTALTTSSLKGGDRAASQTSRARPLAFGFPETLSPLTRLRPAIQTARASSQELRALHGRLDRG